MEGNKEELITERLQELEKEHSLNMELLFRGGTDRETSLIKEIFAKWMDVKKVAKKYHPNKLKHAVIALSGMTNHSHISKTF